jgi:hypothetical protein
LLACLPACLFVCLFVGGEDPQGWVAVTPKSMSADKLRMVCAR